MSNPIEYHTQQGDLYGCPLCSKLHPTRREAAMHCQTDECKTLQVGGWSWLPPPPSAVENATMRDKPAPTRWEDTAMAQEFSKIASEYYRWVETYKNDVPHDDFRMVARVMAMQFENLQDEMVGPL